MSKRILIFFYLFICTSVHRLLLISRVFFALERLALSLFMSRVGTNYYNSSPPTDQSTFFTNFTNRGPYFHICHSFSYYLLEENKFLEIFNFELYPHERMLKLKKPPNHSSLCFGVYKLYVLWLK